MTTELLLAGASDDVAMVGRLLGLLVGVVLHEMAHGYVALRLGDPTAYYAGRITLNPIKHIDLWGTILVPLLLTLSGVGPMLAWAKPVPVNYYNLRYGKWGPVIVALGGPATNLLLLILLSVAARLAPAETALPSLLVWMAFVNGMLLFFNLIPLPPLDGSKVLYLFLERRPDVIQWLERYSMFIVLGVLLVGGSLISPLIIGPSLTLIRLIVG